MRILKIDKNCIYKIKIEKLYEFEDSFFVDVYYKATKCLIDIIDSNKSSYCINSKNKEDDFNNIISFVGERGSGKTSAMISFKNSLQQLYDIDKLIKNNELKEKYVNISLYKFYCLDIIDPSVFDDKDSIIEIVVAEMFKKFKDENKQDYIKKQELVKKFEIVYKDLRALNKDKNTMFKENSDNLEVLMDLSSAIALKNDMVKLVNLYLEYMQEDKGYVNKSFLVITIDDLDMNIAAGEKMIEDIRKYLIIPSVIIMMAVKFDQLEEVIKQKNINDLKVLCDYYRNIDELTKDREKEYMTKALDEELNNKTNKYLEKVIPYNKRIYMPNVYAIDAKIEVHLENFDYKENDSIERFIVNNFYKYLRYTIVTKSHYSAIIPINLRGLVDLIVLFSTFENVEPYMSDGEDIRNRDSIINNLKSIKQYFKMMIIDKTNNFDMRYFLEDLLQCPIQNINKKILLYLNTKLNKIYQSVDKDILNYLDELYKMQRNVIDESVSLGDVVSWMKLYEDIVILHEEKIFIELLKAVYSIRLITELYVGSEELIHIIGKDVVGKYFKFARNKHANKLEVDVEIQGFNLNSLKYSISNKLELPEFIKDYIDIESIKEEEKSNFYRYRNELISLKEIDVWSDKPEYKGIIGKINSLYSILEPQYTEQSTQNLAKLYRNQSNTVDEKKDLIKFYFKPLNILGVNEDVYENLNSSIDKELILEDGKESSNYLLINDYILFLNTDFYMKALKEINKKLHKVRFEKEDNSGTIINEIYGIIQNKFSELLAGLKYIDISNPIFDIVKNKDLSIEFIANNIIIKGQKDIESGQYIEAIKNTQMNRFKRLKKYLKDLQKGYHVPNSTTKDIFKRFESIIKNNYIPEIINLNNTISILNIKDINKLFDRLSNITDIKKQDVNVEKEKSRIDYIINESIQEIENMIKELIK